MRDLPKRRKGTDDYLNDGTYGNWRPNMANVYSVAPDGTSTPMPRIRCKGETRELQDLLERNLRNRDAQIKLMVLQTLADRSVKGVDLLAEASR